MKARNRPKILTLAAAMMAQAMPQLPMPMRSVTPQQAYVFGAPYVRSTGVAGARRAAKKRRRMLAKLPK